MKRLLLIPLLCVTLSAQIMPGARHAAARLPVAASGCPADGSPSAEQATGDSTTYLGLNANYAYVGQRGWQSASARTICKVAFRLSYVEGDITDRTYYAAIFSQDGISLNTALATSGGVTGNNSWDSTWVVFEFATPYEISASTDYSFVVYQDTINGSDYALIDRHDSDASFTGQFEVWSDTKVIQLGVGWETAIRIYWQ